MSRPGPLPERLPVEPLPDLASLSDDDLKKLIEDLQHEEQEVSYRRRLLHGKIDILRAELVARLKESQGRERARPGRRRAAHRDPDRARRAAARARRDPHCLSHVYCPECGFQNPEAANFCARCGAQLPRGEAGPDDDDDVLARASSEADGTDALEELATEGPALVVRSGGGRAGEHFLAERRAHDDRPLARLRHLPRRRHRLAPPRRPDRARRRVLHRGPRQPQRHLRQPPRIESARLESGDEVQVGKYRLTFLSK